LWVKILKNKKNKQIVEVRVRDRVSVRVGVSVRVRVGVTSSCRYPRRRL
jgi:hypothetical protein